MADFFQPQEVSKVLEEKISHSKGAGIKLPTVKSPTRRPSVFQMLLGHERLGQLAMGRGRAQSFRVLEWKILSVFLLKELPRLNLVEG